MRIVVLSLLLGQYPDIKFIPFPDTYLGKLVYSRRKLGDGIKSLSFFGVDAIGNELDETASEPKVSQFPGINKTNQVGRAQLKTTFSVSGDIIDADTETILGVFDPVFQNSFAEGGSLLERVVSTSISDENISSDNSIKKIANAEFLNQLKSDFRRLTGRDISEQIIDSSRDFIDDDFIFSISNGDESVKIERAKKYFDKLSAVISYRDTLVTILNRNREKQEQIDEIEDIFSGQATELQNPSNIVGEVALQVVNATKAIDKIFAGDATKGTLFDHLIEDDTRNLDGPGSGRRFVITDDQIVSCTFNEIPPNMVKVDVTGNAPFFRENGSFEDRYFWAGATDFDLWR